MHVPWECLCIVQPLSSTHTSLLNQYLHQPPGALSTRKNIATFWLTCTATSTIMHQKEQCAQHSGATTSWPVLEPLLCNCIGQKESGYIRLLFCRLTKKHTKSVSNRNGPFKTPESACLKKRKSEETIERTKKIIFEMWGGLWRCPRHLECFEKTSGRHLLWWNRTQADSSKLFGTSYWYYTGQKLHLCALILLWGFV